MPRFFFSDDDQLDEDMIAAIAVVVILLISCVIGFACWKYYQGYHSFKNEGLEINEVNPDDGYRPPESYSGL